MSESMVCAECGQVVSPPSAFHPFLYCELFKKLGVTNQEHYLRSYGFVYDPKVPQVRAETARAVE